MSKISDLALLASRAILGGYLAAHGAQKLGALDGRGLEATGSHFESLGLGPGSVTAPLAAACEIGGGVLTAAGVGGPVGPALIAGTMAVAASTHRAKGPFAAKGGYELPLTNLAAALALAVSGPGRFSLSGGRSAPGRLSKLFLAAVAAGSAAALTRTLGTRPASASEA